MDTLNTTQDVLEQLSLMNYFPTFKENYLTDDIVSELTLSELEEIMKPLGHRKLFLKKFAIEFKKGSPSPQNDQSEVALLTSVTTTTTAHHVAGDMTVGRDINTEMVSTKIQNITNVLEAPDSPVTSFRLLPSPNPHFAGRTKLIGQLRSVFLKMEVEGQVANIHSRILLLTGMRGIGKTEIAQKYAETFYKEHGSVAWLRADSLESISSSFLSLAKDLKLDSVLQANISASQMSSDQLKEMTRAVYSHFSRHVRKGLIIFDGVSNSSSFNMDEFLPAYHQDHFPLILITSRKHSWTFPIASSHRIHVPQWTPEDSLHFLNNQFQPFLQNKNGISCKNKLEETFRKLHEVFEGYPRGLAEATVSILNSISISAGEVRFDSVISSYCDQLLVATSKEFHEMRNSFSAVLSTTFPKSTEQGENKESAMEVLVLMSFLPLPLLVFQDVTSLYGLMHERKTLRAHCRCVFKEGRATAAVVALGADRARESILLLHNLSLIHIVEDLEGCGKKIEIHPAFHKYIRENLGRDESHFGLHGISICLQKHVADPRWRPLLYPIHRALMAQKYAPKQLQNQPGGIPSALEYSLVTVTCLSYWKDHDTASKILEDVTNSPELPDRSPLEEGLNGLLFGLLTTKYLKSQPQPGEVSPSEDKCIFLSFLELYAQNKGGIPGRDPFKVRTYCTLFRQLLAADFRASEMEKDFEKQFRLMKYMEEIWNILYPGIHQEPETPKKQVLHRIVLTTFVPSQSSSPKERESEVDLEVEKFISLSTQKWWRSYFEFLKHPHLKCAKSDYNNESAVAPDLINKLQEGSLWNTVEKLFPYKMQTVAGNEYLWCIKSQFFESFLAEGGSSVVLLPLLSTWAETLPSFKTLVPFYEFLLLLMRALSKRSLGLLSKDLEEALYSFSCRVMTTHIIVRAIPEATLAIHCQCLLVCWMTILENKLELSEEKIKVDSNNAYISSLHQFVVDSKFKDWLEALPHIEKIQSTFFRSIYREVGLLENILEILVNHVSSDGENIQSSLMQKVHHFTHLLRKELQSEQSL